MIRVRQIRVNIDSDQYNEIRFKIAKKLNVKVQEIQDIKISKRSIDARDKGNIRFVYEVDAVVNDENNILKRVRTNDVFKTPDEEYKYVLKYDKNINPIIVGSGPAGLFCAYLLAEAGFKPLIIERGEKVEDRVKTVEDFWKNNNLNLNSNVQFGEGGAGTFSDGKLNTLVKDESYRMKKVFEIFVSCGAPMEIMYVHNPHIGTDILRKVVVNMRNKIISMGGVFRYNTCLTDIEIKNDKVVSVVLNNNEKVLCDTLVLAIGHSSRDTFRMLYNRGIDMVSKPFAVGLRIVHRQDMIDKNQYGRCYDVLGAANYKLTYSAKSGRGVYSFCMCPGGYVVNASSEMNRLVVNGMSNYARDSRYANSAIITSVTKEDFGFGVLDGVKYQEMLEEKAYKLGNGVIPVQRYIDFKNNKCSNCENDLKFIKGEYNFSNMNGLFSDNITRDLIEGIESFNRKILGFADENAYVLGVESRSSSPVRIIRDDCLMSNIKGIYPCGEGAGYAGGITTSAMDGIKVAEKIGKAIIKDF